MEITKADLQAIDNLAKLISRSTTKFELSGDEIPAILLINQWIASFRKRVVEEIQNQEKKEAENTETNKAEALEDKEKAEILDTLVEKASQTTKKKSKKNR